MKTAIKNYKWWINYALDDEYEKRNLFGKMLYLVIMVILGFKFIYKFRDSDVELGIETGDIVIVIDK